MTPRERIDILVRDIRNTQGLDAVQLSNISAWIGHNIEAAVAEATGPLLLKITGLEKGTDDLFKMKNKLLENNAACCKRQSRPRTKRMQP